MSVNRCKQLAHCHNGIVTEDIIVGCMTYSMLKKLPVGIKNKCTMWNEATSLGK